MSIGLAVGICILAAAEGIDEKVGRLLPAGHGSIGAVAAGIDVAAIDAVLEDSRWLLTRLAVGSTTAIVALISLVTTSQRRREIGIFRQRGQTSFEAVAEAVIEMFLLCLIGGAGGLILGLWLCDRIERWIPALPMSPSALGVLSIFPATTLLSCLLTAVIVRFYVRFVNVRQEY